jgi:biofilm PGA synthesis protein PgaD
MTESTEENYIIEDGSLLSFLRKGTEWSVTIVAWSAWVYCFLPLLTLLLWGVGFRVAIIEGVMLDQAAGLASVALSYLVGLLLVVLVIHSWSSYNKHRYGGLDRRRHPAPVADEELEAFFGLPSASLAAARQAERAVVSFDGNAITIETKASLTE